LDSSFGMLTGSQQLRASFDLVATAPPLEPPSGSCCTPSGALPPPPCYYAPTVFVSGAPSAGLPPPPMLPPGVPEPPRAPPRLLLHVPPSPRDAPGSCAPMPTPPWPKTAPPTAAAPWQVGLQMQASSPYLSSDQPTTLSSTVPTGLVTTPVHTPTGSLASSILLSSSMSMIPQHHAASSSQAPLPDFSFCATTAALPPMHSSAADAPGPFHHCGLGAESYGGLRSSSLDDEVTLATSLLTMILSGPPVPPLPPSGCYGQVLISSAISESLGAAAEAVAAAARDLGDKPVKVLLPWYPTHIGTSLFDHTKPAKVMMP